MTRPALRVTAVVVLGLSLATSCSGSGNSQTSTAFVRDPAGLVDTRMWTSPPPGGLFPGGGNTFPGADVPFGMLQWSPDTIVGHPVLGSDYDVRARTLSGYSLTHVSGTGCPAAGDVPVLPMVGAPPAGDPELATTSFSHRQESAEAGYYAATSNTAAPIRAQLTETPHSGMGVFTFPRTGQADFLLKLLGSRNGNWAASAEIAGPDEVRGSVTSGNFCGQPQSYTVYFDLVFDRPFAGAHIIRSAGSMPDAVVVTFDARHQQTVRAKVGISYVSTSNARQNWLRENPGWDFSRVRAAAHQAWNRLLGRIDVAGGGRVQMEEFYSALYKAFVEPAVISDVNGQYPGTDGRVHQLTGGQANQYGFVSGWDIYHSLCQLQAMLAPGPASDLAQSLVNDYAQNHVLPPWQYVNLNNYVMVGDPADAVIADLYAFGARNFDAQAALTDMIAQATTVNTVRPGEALEARDGYLPEDGAYGCCHARGQVASLLEYDNADFAISELAAALGDQRDASSFEQRANNWRNVFDPATGLLAPRLQDGQFVPGVTPLTGEGYVEGTAYEYLWDVPNNYAGLFARLGGDAKVVPALRRYLSQPNGYGRDGRYAQLSNEFDFGEQNALDYAGDPAGTQLAVNTLRTIMYRPGPDGLPNNDDLGANSSAYVWSMLGLYPENPGADTLVFASPAFPAVRLALPAGPTITIIAPGASPTTFYVQSLTVDGRPYQHLSVPFSALRGGATLVWRLGRAPSAWGSAPADAPPSYG